MNLQTIKEQILQETSGHLIINYLNTLDENYNIGEVYLKVGKIHNGTTGPDFVNNRATEYWYIKSGEQDNNEACNYLGEYYENKIKDTIKAEYWYKKGAEQGCIYTQINLAGFYFNKQDFEHAEYWWYKAATNECSENCNCHIMKNMAQNSLGKYFYEIHNDYEEAIYWYKLANNKTKIKEINNNIIKNDIIITKDHNCNICYGPFIGSKKSIITIQCSHSFHYDCIKQWQMKCPYCFIEIQ